MRKFFVASLCVLCSQVASISTAWAADEDKLAGLLSDPNASIASIELSPYRAPRYFIGGGLGFVTSDVNRLINGYEGDNTSTIQFKALGGIDYSPRLAFKYEFNYHTFTDTGGYQAYQLLTNLGSAQINFIRSRGIIPYLKIGGGLATTNRDLSKQFGSSSKSITVGQDTSLVFDIGGGIMYDAPKSWLADGDVRLLFDYTERRDNNDTATPVAFFQENIISIYGEYLFGSSVFFGQKIIVEREVTSDEGGDQGIFREKREPVLYPSAAELAALSDESQPSIIFFRQFSSYIVDTQTNKLNAMVEELDQNPNAQAVITGHSDKNDFIYDRIEQLKFNRSISAKRAVAVYRYLVAKGIDPERITLQWRADQQVVSKKDDAVSRSLNRRVQVLVR